MNTQLYVSNLAYSVSAEELQQLFVVHGPVREVHLEVDAATGRLNGSAMVTMATEEGAQAALQALNGHDLQGRALEVEEARFHEDRVSFGGSRGTRRRFSQKH